MAKIILLNDLDNNIGYPATIGEAVIVNQQSSLKDFVDQCNALSEVLAAAINNLNTRLANIETILNLNEITTTETPGSES